MGQTTLSLNEALDDMRCALGKRRGKLYPRATPDGLRQALRGYVAAWEAWRGEGGEGWFPAKPLAERAIANEARATSAKLRRVLRRLDPDGEVPLVNRPWWEDRNGH